MSRVVVPLLAALPGYGIGWLAGAVGSVSPKPADFPFLVEHTPLPHHVPKYPGGLSFRFAMAHDVLHERFPKHGPAHYQERNRLTREKLAKLAPDDPARFPLEDDLGAGLDRLGRAEEAVAVLQDKLTRQLAKGLAGRDLYTSYANLGTFIMHANQPKAVAGDPAARKRFREGVELVRKSVEVNPQAHFGREQWQVVLGEFLLAAMEKPALLREFDFVGNRFHTTLESMLNREMNWDFTGYGRPTDAEFSQGKVAYQLPAFFRPGIQAGDPALWPELNPIRQHILKIGAEDGWDKVNVPAHRKRVAFDEPVLAIIGIWRQGSGANPHFALALGEIMLRAGQRYIAWTAYERASRMAERFWPDPEFRKFLRDHCKERQADIEKSLLFQKPESSSRKPWQHVSPPPDANTVADLRAVFDAELAHGESYQRAYQEYEAERIEAGASITDEHFFDEFLASREPIASSSGPEEWFAGVSGRKMSEYLASRRQAWGLVGAGLTALLTSLFLWWRAGRASD
jgi:hypothetical protein